MGGPSTVEEGTRETSSAPRRPKKSASWVGVGVRVGVLGGNQVTLQTAILGPE